MTVDREQIGRDEWLEAFHLAFTWVPLKHYDEVQKRAERALGEILAELEQAERERDEARKRLSATVKSATALVEALQAFSQWDFDTVPLPTITRLVFHEDRQRARDALAAWEQE